MSVKNTINIYCVLYVKTYNKYNIYAYPEGDDQFFKCMISMLYSWPGRWQSSKALVLWKKLPKVREVFYVF